MESSSINIISIIHIVIYAVLLSSCTIEIHATPAVAAAQRRLGGQPYPIPVSSAIIKINEGSDKRPTGSRSKNEDANDQAVQPRSLRNVVTNVMHEIDTLVINSSSSLVSTTPVSSDAFLQRRRSLGGGPTTTPAATAASSSSSSSSTPASASTSHHRSLYQEWARDTNGNILWWIWLIIALCIAGCLCVCCCFSVCCLRD